MSDGRSKLPELEYLKKERQLKKLRLFLSIDNPVWNLLLKLERAGLAIVPAPRIGKPIPVQLDSSQAMSREPLVAICAKHLGVTGEWRRSALAGVVPDPHGTCKRIHGLMERLASFAKTDRTMKGVTRSYETAADAEEIVQRLGSFILSYEAGDPVYVAARALGMSVDECQMALDKLFFSHGSLLRSPFFAAEPSALEIANSRLRQLRGVYYAYMRRTSTGTSGERDTYFLKCALRVRYLLKLQGGYLIRVKLNMPRVDPSADRTRISALLHGEPPLIEYDGFCYPRDRCHMVLEERSLESDADMISLVINTFQEPNGHMRGRYLTVGQDTERSIVNDDVILERIPESEFEDADDEMRGKIMRRSARVVPRKDLEFSRIEALFGGG